MSVGSSELDFLRGLLLDVLSIGGEEHFDFAFPALIEIGRLLTHLLQDP